MAEARPKKVTIDDSDQRNPLVLQTYAKLVASLKKKSALPTAVTSSLSEPRLAELIISLRRSLEELCGKEAPKPRPVTKFPMGLFQDYTVGGAVDIMLTTICQDVANNGGTLADVFSNNSRARTILIAIENELVKSGHLKWPKVFLNKVPVGKLNLLSRIVQDHGGALVTSEEAASHVVDWNEEVDAAQEPSDDFIRILEVRGPRDAAKVRGGGAVPAVEGAALVHWWYYPDSYNEWIPDTEISAGDAPDLTSATAATRDKWYVCCRFITDCEVFNEWGNPADYESESVEEEAAAEQLSAAAAGAELLLSGAESPRVSSKKGARGKKRFSQLAAAAAQDKEKSAAFAKDVPVIGTLAGTEKLQPDAIPPSLRPEGPAQVVDLAAPGGEVRAVTVGSAEAGSKRSAAEAQLDALAAPAECTLPSGAAEPVWFQQSAVSEFETQVLGGACTADAADYLKVRNGIINLCAQSPLQYITATECRRKLPGDVSRILQLHEFLNAFGLINCRARREARPDVPAPLMTTSAGALARSRPQAVRRMDGSWTAKEDAALQDQVGRHTTGATVDWAAVASGLGGDRAAVDCAARFVALQIPTGHSATHAKRAGDLAAMLKNVTHAARTAPLSATAARAASFAVRAAVDGRLEQQHAALEALSGEYLQGKLALLQEKVSLLQGVEAVFEAERSRMDADRRELQVLRAQLALAQQSLQPADAALGPVV